MDAPIWLEAFLFQKILRKFEKDETIEVSSISIKPAVAKGANYMSNLFRANVEFSRIVEGRKTLETKSLIVKVQPQGGAHEQLIKELRFFEVEIAMLSETLPRMGQILRNKLDEISLAPQCLHVQREEPMYLILEDLASRGFRMVDSSARFDLDHSLLAMRNLAAFHASSVALIEQDPEIVKKYDKGLFHKDYSSRLQSQIAPRIISLAENVAKWPELSPRIAEKILKHANVMYDRVCEAIAYSKSDFNVINHADLWVNNMLFRYDDQQKPIDLIFVDFQICYYGSPAIDILRFFGRSLSNKVWMHDQELLLREYHTSLIETMTKLECNTQPPSFKDLKKSLEELVLCELFPSLVMLPFSLVEKSDVETTDESTTLEGRHKNPAGLGQFCRETMVPRLQFYDNMGLLDLEQ